MVFVVAVAYMEMLGYIVEAVMMLVVSGAKLVRIDKLHESPAELRSIFNLQVLAANQKIYLDTKIFNIRLCSCYGCACLIGDITTFCDVFANVKHVYCSIFLKGGIM